MRPLLVVEGPAAAASARVATALAAASSDGWAIVHGWAAPLSRDRVVCTGPVRSADDARRALLAAVAGAGLVVAASADRETIDRFLDDLRRLGAVDHVVVPPGSRGQHSRSGRARDAITPGQRALLGLLAEGLTVREAASELGVGARTADRRLAAARLALGVDSTAAAIVLALASRR